MKQELVDRQAQRDTLAALFRRRPLEPITPAELRAITPHYQQRISECRRQLGMTLKNVQQWRTDDDGVKHRIDGSYVFVAAPVPSEPPEQQPLAFEVRT